MDEREREELEGNIRGRAEAKDISGAISVAMRGYGPELFRFLLAFHRDEEAASEVFSCVAEGLWRGVATFTWESSFRSFAYAVARRASLRYRRDAGRRARRQVPLDEIAALSAIEAEIRSETLSYLRTERRSRFAALRDALPPDDRALLFLRVDRRLSWNDIVHAMRADEGEVLAGEVVKREAARLRKRFQLVKEKLLEQGRREGLVGSGEDDR